MIPSHTSSDTDLLATLSQRLQERHGALQQTAELLGEVRALNAKLEIAERLKGRFLSNIRNEINNPLTTVRGFAAAIAGNRGLSHEQIHVMANHIYREMESLSFQMENIFAAADLEAGVVGISRTYFSVNALIASVVSDLQCVATFKKVKITVEYPESIAGISDAAKLALIFSNLLHNAIEYARELVFVRLHADQGLLTIDVLDDGPGFDACDVGPIFDRFVQLSSGSTKTHPGQGLGLSVARGLSDLIDGSIEVVATSAAGTHFRIQCPLGESDGSHDGISAANEVLFEVTESF